MLWRNPNEEKKKPYAEIGEKYFYLEEIFVLKDFRNMKIGENLFKFAEDYAKREGCKTMRLSAVSKNYNKLLKFYIEHLNMEFLSAYLIKKID